MYLYQAMYKGAGMYTVRYVHIAGMYCRHVLPGMYKVWADAQRHVAAAGDSGLRPANPCAVLPW